MKPRCHPRKKKIRRNDRNDWAEDPPTEDPVHAAGWNPGCLGKPGVAGTNPRFVGNHPKPEVPI